jgi:hypothetical protein
MSKRTFVMLFVAACASGSLPHEEPADAPTTTHHDAQNVATDAPVSHDAHLPDAYIPPDAYVPPDAAVDAGPGGFCNDNTQCGAGTCCWVALCIPGQAIGTTLCIPQ